MSSHFSSWMRLELSIMWMWCSSYDDKVRVWSCDWILLHDRLHFFSLLSLKFVFFLHSLLLGSISVLIFALILQLRSSSRSSIPSLFSTPIPHFSAWNIVSINIYNSPVIITYILKNVNAIRQTVNAITVTNTILNTKILNRNLYHKIGNIIRT